MSFPIFRSGSHTLADSPLQSSKISSCHGLRAYFTQSTPHEDIHARDSHCPDRSCADAASNATADMQQGLLIFTSRSRGQYIVNVPLSCREASCVCNQAAGKACPNPTPGGDYICVLPAELPCNSACLPCAKRTTAEGKVSGCPLRVERFPIAKCFSCSIESSWMTHRQR